MRASACLQRADQRVFDDSVVDAGDQRVGRREVERDEAHTRMLERKARDLRVEAGRRDVSRRLAVEIAHAFGRNPSLPKITTSSTAWNPDDTRAAAGCRRQIAAVRIGGAIQTADAEMRLPAASFAASAAAPSTGTGSGAKLVLGCELDDEIMLEAVAAGHRARSATLQVRTHSHTSWSGGSSTGGDGGWHAPSSRRRASAVPCAHGRATRAEEDRNRRRSTSRAKGELFAAPRSPDSRAPERAGL